MLSAVLLFWSSLTGFDPPPPAEDVLRFPPAWLCEAQVRFYDSRLEWLEGQRDFYGDSYWSPWHQAAKQDALDRRRCWVLLLDAREQWALGGRGPQAPYWDGEGYRRHDWRKEAEADLVELRELLGVEMYSSGQMPGPMDWKFTRR